MELWGKQGVKGYVSEVIRGRREGRRKKRLGSGL